MALSREQIADELLKLLDIADPSTTIAIMLRHGILMPVLPEIAEEGVADLKALIAAEERVESLPPPSGGCPPCCRAIRA